MVEQIVEVPLEASPLMESTTPTEVSAEVSPAAPPAVSPEVAAPKKRTGRPKGSKDTKPRARPKARPATDVRPTLDAPPGESDNVGDIAALREVAISHLLRSVHQYHGAQQDRRQKLYAGWFGR